MEAPTNTYPSSTTTPPAPPPSPAPQPEPSKRNYVTIGIIAVVVLLIAAAFLHPGIRSWLMSLTGLQLEERSVLLKGMTSEGAVTLLELTGDKVAPAEFPEGFAVASSRAGVTAGVKGTDLMLAKGKKSEVLFSDFEHKEAVAVAPDGSAVAFASMTPGAVGEGVARWYVKTANIATKEVSILGIGYAPQFVLRDGKSYVLFTSPKGIELVDTATSEVVTTPVSLSQAERHSVVVSDDGGHLAIYEPIIGQYFVYRVDGVKPDHLSFSALRDLPKEVVSVAFRGGKLYAVSASETGQELLVFAAADAPEPESRVVLPESSAHYELLP